MECPARMIGEPFEDVGLFVGGIVVDDGVNDFSDRHAALDGVEEADELLMAVALHVSADHGAVEDVEGGDTALSCRDACNHGSSSRIFRA